MSEICQYCNEHYSHMMFGVDDPEDGFKGCYNCWCEWCYMIDDGVEPKEALEDMKYLEISK